MIIRNAVLSDAETISTYLMLAMEDILYKFMGLTNAEKARDFLLHFVKLENNQYSYQNCFVAEENSQVIAALNIYEGAKLEQLRSPICQYVQTNYSKEFNPEDETQAGEYYIDSFGVHPDHQGKGIGAKMLQLMITTYVHRKKETLGLLVDEENPQAKKLYLKLGFVPAGEKILVGKRMVHMQIKYEPLLQ